MSHGLSWLLLSFLLLCVNNLRSNVSLWSFFLLVLCSPASLWAYISQILVSLVNSENHLVLTLWNDTSSFSFLGRLSSMVTGLAKRQCLQFFISRAHVVLGFLGKIWSCVDFLYKVSDWNSEIDVMLWLYSLSCLVTPRVTKNGWCFLDGCVQGRRQVFSLCVRWASSVRDSIRSPALP